MSALRGFLAGTLVVASAEVLVSSPSAAGRIGGFGDFLGVVIDRVVNPDIPAVGTVNFIPPLPIVFGDTSTPTQPGGSGSSTPKRSKQLHSTKARPPRQHATAPGVRRLATPGGR